jgi:hypothetical protein
MKNQRISIVFEATAQSRSHFNVYMEGLDKEELYNIPESEWPRAAYWAIKCFQIVTATIAKTGAVESIEMKKKG